jgi:hypothetical protein
MHWFNFDTSRSERALQTEILAPALRDREARWALLRALPGMTRAECDEARVMHFVWVLRDAFHREREHARADRAWEFVVARWASILGLPPWATNIDYWRHPEGYRGDPNYLVHPTQKRLGWTREGLDRRYSAFAFAVPRDEVEPVLVEAREVMNTECDCFIQTPRRLIVLECKDKTGFNTEQRRRQRRLFGCLERLLERPERLAYVELAARHGARGGAEYTLTWDDARTALASVGG